MYVDAALLMTNDELSELAFHAATFPRLYQWLIGGPESLCKMCANIIIARNEVQ